MLKMKQELGRVISTLQQFRESNGHRFASMEVNRRCNRACDYCTVPQQYSMQAESSVADTFKQIDRLRKEGYRVLNYVGGEPLAPFRTKEGITFLDHTVRAVKHATDNEMLVNVTTNADYVRTRPEILKRLAEAGLDTLTFSLHTYDRKSLDRILESAQKAARLKIVPIVNIVFTADRADTLPLALACVAEAGALGSTTVVQEKGGGGFSSKPEESKIPSPEQQAEVFSSLSPLKKAGLIRNNWNYLKHATDYPGNSWTCDAENDRFIHVGADGKANVCSEVRTDFNILDLTLNGDEWRKVKRDLVKNCGNCLYSCYYETENPNFKGDIPTFIAMSLIKTGHADLVRRWGQFVVARLLDDPKFNWQPNINGQRRPQRIFVPEETILYNGQNLVVPVDGVAKNNGVQSTGRLEEMYLEIIQGVPVYRKRVPPVVTKAQLAAVTLLGTSQALGLAVGFKTGSLEMAAGTTAVTMAAGAAIGIGSALRERKKIKLRSKNNIFTANEISEAPTQP